MSEERRRTIAVDVDGVIANYDGWREVEHFGSPRADVLEALRVLRRAGWKIVVHTTRAEEYVRPYLLLNNIPHDEINSNNDYLNGGTKPIATVYWDDRASCLHYMVQTSLVGTFV